MYTLEDVVAAFESWRANRANRKEQIPDKLWSMAKALLPYYKKAHIQKALRLSGRQFNKRCLPQQQQQQHDDYTTMQNDGFVSDVLPMQSIYDDDKCELTLQGMRKSLCIKVSITQISQVLTLVEGYL